MGSRAKQATVAAVAGALALGLAAGSAPGAPTASNLSLKILVGTAARNIPQFQNGESTTVPRLNFKAGVSVGSTGPEGATFRVRFELSAALHWGFDLPDSGDNCTSTPSVGECRSSQELFTAVPEIGWFWDVVADAPGTYVLKAEVIESSTSDPDPSNNAASVTVVVTQPSVTAGAARVSPARPKAGSVVSARVGVSAGETAVDPSSVTCAGLLGKRRVAGMARASDGAATCRYRTPRSAKGKTLQGTISFSAEQMRFRRTFAVRLR
jgi:hypothetical protein